MGGRVEPFYYAFGANAFFRWWFCYVVVELPEQVSAVAARGAGCVRNYF
jgi:hypothetical protein